jgi:hypothetical protein
MAHRRLAALAVLASVIGILAPTVSAAPDNEATITYELTDCVGPPGTPATLEGTKQPHEGAALHLTDGSGNFVFKAAEDAITHEVFFVTPGFDKNAHDLVVCKLTHPLPPHEKSIVSGLISPAK